MDQKDTDVLTSRTICEKETTHFSWTVFEAMIQPGEDTTSPMT
jgi:hypothetical protein